MAGNELNPLFNGGSTPAARQLRMNAADDPTSQLTQQFSSALNQLTQLWDQVHLDQATRAARVRQASEFVSNLLRDIVTAEEQMIRGISNDLEARRQAVTQLRGLFSQPPFDESLYPNGSIALLKALDTEMNRLAKKREDMMAKQQEYYERYKLLCQRLGITDPLEVIDGVDERIFSENELASLRDKVTEQKNIFKKRLDKLFQLQCEAKKIFDTVQLPSNRSFSEEDLQYLKMDLNSQNCVLSPELLFKMEALNQRLRDQYDHWIEQVAFRYDELLIKLDDLSEKCFRPPVSKDYPEHLNPDRLNEKELQKLEEELQARQELYKRAQPVFDKLNEWMDAWKQKLDTERRVCRASFYKNRAGSLTSKLKQRKLLDQKVPRTFNELHELCEEYVKKFRVFDILVEGMRADKYAEHVVKTYEQDRELQRAQRQFTNSRTAQTPGRTHSRNVFATPSRQAMRALNPQQPATVGGQPRKRSFSCSQLSAIHPLQSPMSGPRTSSPKQDWSSSS